MKPNEELSYQVWNKETKEMILCESEKQAFKIAEQIKSRVWLCFDDTPTAILDNK